MLNKNFGIEIEFTGITRSHAAKILSQNLENRTVRSLSDSFDTRVVVDEKARKWKIMSDGSLKNEKKINGMKIETSSQYSVELVSPILNYHDDIETLQTLIREFRKAGAFTNETCGIHIHLDGTDHNAKSIKNFIKIIASKNDLFYEALQIKPQRRRYCEKMDEKLVKAIKSKRPKTLQELEEIWYEGYAGYRQNHYHNSRYHFLNLHSFFHGNKTIELRGFNSELHAGKVRSYIVLALALNNQALTQNCASDKKPQEENKKFAMRTYLNRIGLIGKEFKNCREHLTAKLNGCSAWRFGAA